MNTNGIGQADVSATTSYASVDKTSSVTSGKTIGNPELSDTAKEYYEQLKKKYSNMEFILVSPEKKAEAEASISNYKSSKELIVLIDSDKIENMATDENYRKKYESILDGATAQLNQVKTSLGSVASAVKSFGLKIDDGGNASFFAVIDKSLAAQKERIEKKAEKKAADKKKEAKEAQKDRLDKLKEEKKESADKADKTESTSDYVTVLATSLDDLIKKIQDTVYGTMSDNVETEAEKMLGRNIDYTA